MKCYNWNYFLLLAKQFKIANETKENTEKIVTYLSKP